MILGDRDLKYYIKIRRLIVEPFSEEIIRENGLDVRLSNEIARLKNNTTPVDTRAKDLDPSSYYEVERGDFFIINPHERVLLNTIEYIMLPDDLMAFVNLRSTYARLGLAAPPTIVDAGFQGNITIEVTGGPFPVKLYAGDRFAHLIFAKVLSPVENPYKGEYQGQRGVRFPKMFKQR